jgi:hypothetical protein
MKVATNQGDCTFFSHAVDVDGNAHIILILPEESQ